MKMLMLITKIIKSKIFKTMLFPSFSSKGINIEKIFSVISIVDSITYYIGALFLIVTILCRANLNFIFSNSFFNSSLQIY